MRVAIIGNPKPYEVSRIRDEFLLRNTTCGIVSIKDLCIIANGDGLRIETKIENDFLNYDVYFFRGIGSALPEMALIAEYLYRYHNKIIVEEKLATGRIFRTKLSDVFLDTGVSFTPTICLFSYNDSVSGELGFPLIVKGMVGSKGKTVRKAENQKEFKKVYAALGPKVMVQKFFPITYDYRVLIVGDAVLGVIKRYNSPHNFLTNISAGGIAEKSHLPEEVLDVCMRAKSIQKIEIAGIDVIEWEGGYYIIEINLSPQFRGFEEATGVNVAGAIAEYMVQKLTRKSS